MAASATILSPNPTTAAAINKLPFITASSAPRSPTFSLKLPTNSPNYSSTKPLISRASTHPHPHREPFSALAPLSAAAAAAAAAATETPPTNFHGVCYVVGDNIDTDQIIPAEYLTLVPSNPEEYKKLGSYALIGLPSPYETRFVEPGQLQSNFTIVIGGDNFGCGSSREHAPVALGASGVAAVVAESYARIFFRNSVATGEIYPLESEVRLCEECRTGDMVTIVLGDSKLINHTSGKEYKLKPIGDAGPVIEAGGIFAYARKTGMIPSR